MSFCGCGKPIHRGLCKAKQNAKEFMRAKVAEQRKKMRCVIEESKRIMKRAEDLGEKKAFVNCTCVPRDATAHPDCRRGETEPREKRAPSPRPAPAVDPVAGGNGSAPSRTGPVEFLKVDPPPGLCGCGRQLRHKGWCAYMRAQKAAATEKHLATLETIPTGGWRLRDHLGNKITSLFKSEVEAKVYLVYLKKWNGPWSSR